MTNRKIRAVDNHVYPPLVEGPGSSNLDIKALWSHRLLWYSASTIKQHFYAFLVRWKCCERMKVRVCECAFVLYMHSIAYVFCR